MTVTDGIDRQRTHRAPMRVVRDASSSRSRDVEPYSDAGPNGTEKVQRERDYTAVILYTSGTTGRPSPTTTRSAARPISRPTRCSRSVTPTSYSAGLRCSTPDRLCGLKAAINVGACLTPLPRFDPGGALEALQRDRVAVFEA